MASLLATQLNRLAIPEGQLISADLRRRKSLLYSEIELNKVDTAAHLERAQKAFRHLVNIDSGLEQFFDCFFSEERVHFEPTMQTPEQKATLDQFVEHFLIRMSQHLLLGVALEALEWLVYKFHIHLYNMDAVLQAVFPYHSTNLFPKFLQLFEFNALNKRWHWLRPLANQGLPLVRSELIRVATRDEAVLNFVCHLVARALKVFGPEEARLQLFVNLYSQVTLGVLMTPIDGRALTRCVNSLNFYIVKGLRSSVKCYRHSAYQIVQLLAAKHQLSASVLNVWMKRLLKSSCKYEPTEVCLLLAALCKTQKCTMPQELADKFESVCEQCESTVLNDFPEIVGRSTEQIDIVMDIPEPAFEEQQQQQQQQQREEEQRQSAAASAKKEQQQQQLEASVGQLLLADRSPLTAVACLLTLLPARAQSLRGEALACLSAIGQAASQPAASDEDELILATVGAVAASSQAIERDSQAALQPALASVCCPLLWRSLRDLLPRQPITALQRRCLLAHLRFFGDASLTQCLADGDDAAVRQLARIVNYADSVVARAAAAKVSANVFNALRQQHKATYLMEGLGCSELTEDAGVLKLCSAYQVEKEVYMDGLANLFALVPSNASIRNLSARRKSCSFGNVYREMPKRSRRQMRFLFALLRASGADSYEDGLQLMIRLLEVLQILVQAHNQQADSATVRDICQCLLCADKVARGSQADSGLADLVPAQAVLDCVRAVQDRQCQYIGIGVLCRLCERAPSCVSRCFTELVQFLVDTKFFSREDAHTEQLWRALLSSVVPPCASGVPLMRQLLSAYDDVPPSRRADLYRDVATALGPEDNLWALLLLLNLRAAPPPAGGHASKKRRLAADAAPQEEPVVYDPLGSSVLATFPVPLQLASCARALDCLLAALGHREVTADLRLGHQLPEDAGALALQLGGALALVTAHLGRRDLLGHLGTDAGTEAMTELLRALVDCLLWATGSQGHHRPLGAAAVRAIERAEAIVPGTHFLRVVTGLLAHSDAGVQRKALDLLLGKLSGLDPSAVPHLREPLVACADAIGGHLGSQVALICAKELARLLGGTQPQLVTQLCRSASAASLRLVEQQINWELCGCCLLLNAEAVKQSGVATLPVVVQVLPGLLRCLRRAQPPPVALLAAYAYIQQCVLSLCDLLVPYLRLLLPITAHYVHTVTSQPLLTSKLRSVLNRVGRSVEPAQLLPVLLQCSRGGQHPEEYARLLRLCSQAAAARRSDSMDEFEAELAELFAQLLGARERAGGDCEREGDIARQLARCLLLLPAPLQSSLAQSLLDWCGSDLLRQLPAYRTLECALAGGGADLAGRLADLELGASVAQLLESLRVSDANAAPAGLLLCSLLTILRRLFASAPLGVDQLDGLGRLAVAQLDNGAELPGFADRVANFLLPCLCDFAEACAGDETLLKPLVRQLCDRCQSEGHHATRYWALRALKGLAAALDDLFIDSLAADCVPTLAECAEDDSEEIEALAQQLLADIERRVGEPLQL